MRPLLAYVTTVCEPLTGLTRRVAVSRAAVAEIQADPVRAGVWMAAMLRPFVRALPADDPWRHVTVRLPDGTTSPGPDITASTVASSAVPPIPGALARGRPYGTVEDHFDLIPAGASDVADDLALAGVADPLPLPSAYLLSTAGWGSLGDLAGACHRVTVLSPEDGGYTVPGEWEAAVATGGGHGFFVMAEALSRAMFRYRTYVGDAAVSAEAPQLAYEVDFWAAALPVSTAADGGEAARAMAVAGGQPPTLRTIPIPDDSYASFRLDDLH